MKQFSFFLLLCITGTFSMAQADSLRQQINKQVWKPFIQSFNNLDTDGFMGVHSKDMTRVIQDDNRIYGYDKYYQDNKTGNERNRQNKRKRVIELRFIQRIAGNDRGFEIGYYKTTATMDDGSQRSFYGKFHVLLRKENGTWKILMDADASEKTDETIFMTGAPLE